MFYQRDNYTDISRELLDKIIDEARQSYPDEAIRLWGITLIQFSASYAYSVAANSVMNACVKELCEMGYESASEHLCKTFKVKPPTLRVKGLEALRHGLKWARRTPVEGRGVGVFFSEDIVHLLIEALEEDNG
jgi:hypothetical protein